MGQRVGIAGNRIPPWRRLETAAAGGHHRGGYRDGWTIPLRHRKATAPRHPAAAPRTNSQRRGHVDDGRRRLLPRTRRRGRGPHRPRGRTPLRAGGGRPVLKRTGSAKGNVPPEAFPSLEPVFVGEYNKGRTGSSSRPTFFASTFNYVRKEGCWTMDSALR